MKRFAKISVKIILIGLVIAIMPNYFSRIYKFEDSQKFTGDQFYNPYKDLSDTWIKANFHAHAKAYGGFANGKNSASEMLAKYDSLDYDLACISNYGFVLDSISGHKYMPVYEHGFNWRWIHQLVINETKSKPFDYPFFQNRSTRQHIINRLKTDDNLIVLNHPNHKKAYRSNDLKYLNNYDLFEGISEFAGSISQWDIALSSGHAVWILGNDDSHDLSDYHIGIAWDMINVESNNNEEIIKSLKAGKTYATKGWLGQEMNKLEKLTVEDGSYNLKMERKADSIVLISDDGKVVSSITNSDSISYQIQNENTYVRAQIFETEKWNKYTMMYLNPVVRTETIELLQHNNQNKVNYFLSIIYWMVLFGIQLGLVVFVWKG
jgi:hypothetical protein